MKLLRQSTAKVISFGPFVAPSDGVTLVTNLISALDHASTGIFVDKNGAGAAIRHQTVTATTYSAYGMYEVTLDATDTATLGHLRVSFAAAGSCLPVWEDFQVIPANIYDSLVLGTDVLDVSLIQLLGTAPTEGATGRLAAALTKFFDKASPTGTISSLPDAVAGAGGGLAIVGSAMALAAAQIIVKKNVAFPNFTFLLVDSSNVPAPGKSVTAQRRIDAGSFGACANAVTEVAYGLYTIDLAAADLNGAMITLRFSSSGAADRVIGVLTQA